MSAQKCGAPCQQWRAASRPEFGDELGSRKCATAWGLTCAAAALRPVREARWGRRLEALWGPRRLLHLSVCLTVFEGRRRKRVTHAHRHAEDLSIRQAPKHRAGPSTHVPSRPAQPLRAKSGVNCVKTGMPDILDHRRGMPAPDIRAHVPRAPDVPFPITIAPG